MFVPYKSHTMDVFKFITQADNAGNPFVKLSDGDSVRLRLISQPLCGHEQFIEGKPQRWPAGQSRPDGLPASSERPRAFLAFIVFQYTPDPAVRIWQFTQQSVFKQLEMLFQGGKVHWSSFILTLQRKGSGLDTTWNIAGAQVPLEAELIEFAAKADEYVDLNALFLGDSPIIQPLPEIRIEEKPTQADDLPF